MQFDIELIAREVDTFRQKIGEDYEVEVDLDRHALPFPRKVVEKMGQNRPAGFDPLDQHLSNAEVFRAAVMSLGSSMRDWAVFKRRADAANLDEVLHHYDPAAVADDVDRAALESIFYGLTARTDIDAIIKWAHRLAADDDYYATICDVGNAFNDLNGAPLDPAHLMPCVVSYFVNPTVRWPGNEYLTRAAVVPVAERKVPGMSHALGSEFLRNLGWPGFKPDVHIVGLLNTWVEHDELSALAATAGFERLLMLIKQRNQPVQNYLRYTLAGVALTPEHMTYTETDNLLWMFGHYVGSKQAKKTADDGRPFVS